MKIKEITTGNERDVKIAFLKANRDLDLKAVLERKEVIEKIGYIETESIIYTVPSKCTSANIEFEVYNQIKTVLETKSSGARKVTKITGFEFVPVDSSFKATDENTIIVLDGQHRITASMLINNEKPNSIIPTSNKLDDKVDVFEYIKLVNNERKPWKATDYLKAVAVKNDIKHVYQLLEHANKINANQEVLLNFYTLPKALIKKSKLAELTTASSEDVKKIVNEYGFTENNFKLGKKVFDAFNGVNDRFKNNTRFARVFKLHYSNAVNNLNGSQLDEYIKNLISNSELLESLFVTTTKKQLKDNPNLKERTYESNLDEVLLNFRMEKGLITE